MPKWSNDGGAGTRVQAAWGLVKCASVPEPPSRTPRRRIPASSAELLVFESSTAISGSAVFIDVKQPFAQRPVLTIPDPAARRSSALQQVYHTSAWTGMGLEIWKQAVPLCRYVQYCTVCHACACDCNAPRLVLDPTNYRTILPPSSGFLLSKTPALTDLVKPHFCLVLPQASSPVCLSVCLCPAVQFFLLRLHFFQIVSSRPPMPIVSVYLHFKREPLP